MSKTAKPKAREKLPPDAEARALMANPAFRTLLQEAKGTSPEAYVSLEELDRRLGPLAEQEQRFANAYGDVLDQLAGEQNSEVTDQQGRLIQLVLLAAAHVRGESSPDQLAAASGLPVEDIRAAAAALRALGLGRLREGKPLSE